MDDDKRNNDDFNIIGGGPLYRFFMRLGIDETNGYSAWKASLIFTLVAWVPLYLLAFMQQRVLGVSPHFTLFNDVLVYVRWFIVIGFSFTAVTYIKPGISLAVREFRRSGIVRPEDYRQLSAVQAAATRWQNSSFAEIMLIIAAYAGAYFGLRAEWHDQVSTWLAVIINGHERLTPAGWWYLLVTTPLFQLLLYRWLWRLCIWYRMLWGVSRLPLQLVPTHPDLMGGLGFILIGHAGFAYLIFAASAIISASVENSYLRQNIQPQTYLPLFVGVISILLIVFIVPLLMFTLQLIDAKRQGLIDYNLLASNYVRAFAVKWINGGSGSPEQLLGNADIQSLADMANNFNTVRKMQVIPFAFNTLVLYLAAAVMPLIPLLFTIRSLREIVNILVKLVLP